MEQSPFMAEDPEVGSREIGAHTVLAGVQTVSKHCTDPRSLTAFTEDSRYQAMKIEHRGLRIELDDTDARVRVFEAVLFGGPLPEVLDLAALPKIGGPAPSGPPPVSEAMKTLWGQLKEGERKELLLIASEPLSLAGLERAMGVREYGLQGRHARMSRIARSVGIYPLIRSRGRKRAGRRYYLAPEIAEAVRRLSQPAP